MVLHASRGSSGRFESKSVSRIPVDRYREYVFATRSKETAYTYLAAIRRFDKFLVEKEISLKDASPNLLDDFVIWLSKRELSPASIGLTITGVRNYINWFRKHENGCVQFEKPVLPKQETKIPFILSEQDLQRVLREITKLRDPSKTALLVMLYSGLRVSELCKVETNRISTEKDRHGLWTIIEVKGKGNKTRQVYLFPRATDLLAGYIAGWRKWQRKSKWLFPGKDIYGREVDSLSPATLQAHLRIIREKLDIKEQLTPHLLRRTCFTYLYRRGTNIYTIAKIAGHESVDTTMKHYIAASPKDIIKELANTIER